jgi:hypothetical protein
MVGSGCESNCKFKTALAKLVALAVLYCTYTQYIHIQYSTVRYMPRPAHEAHEAPADQT